ncbi:hypothetical protein AAG570_012038 [Ranatra chinensis]|uniref:Biogenesis of lysosome-related organelles complex 1 subunit 4 n=1 Tax=Ranatra chinensis TaxID=642074 RepID=A0ABD0YU15_9HEMI
MERSEVEILAKEYSGYLKVDISPHVRNVEESIDETLTRLEEFESVLEMASGNLNLIMKRDPNEDVTSLILDQRNELLTICEKVHRLESFIGTVRQTVDKMEKLVTNAELDLKNTTEGKIRSILKPFFRRSDSDVGVSSRSGPVFTPPEIFSTSQLIKSSCLDSNQEAQLNA